MCQYAQPDVLVDSQWLLDHLADPTVRVVEVDMSPEPFRCSINPQLLERRLVVVCQQSGYILVDGNATCLT